MPSCIEGTGHHVVVSGQVGWAALARRGAFFGVEEHEHPEAERLGVALAVLALVISHLDDRMHALREIHHILRPGGHLVISTEHPTADWLKLGGSYFIVEVVEETWAKGWEMRSWRLPLGVVCDEFRAAGFLIERVVEPQPVPEMAERYPSYYEKLNREPGFIAFRLVKPA